MSRSQDERTLRTLVGKRLRVRRIWLEFSQEEVATRAGVTRNFVSAIERGAQGLDAFRLGQIADALDVSLIWLLDGPDDQVTSPAPGTLPSQWEANTISGHADAGTADGQRTVMTTESVSASQEWPVPGPHMT